MTKPTDGKQEPGGLVVVATNAIPTGLQEVITEI
jgi:hypothetical protein